MLLTVNKINDNIAGVIGKSKYCVPYSSALYQDLLEAESAFDKASSIEEATTLIEMAKERLESIEAEAKHAAYGEYLKHDAKAQKFYLHSNGVTSSIPLPKALADKIVEATDKDLPSLPFIKAWMWFLKNPKFTLRKADYFAKYITTTYVDKEMRDKLIEDGYATDKAIEMATFNDVAITKNGLLSTYKYARIKYIRHNPETGEVEDRYDVSFDPETGAANVNLPINVEDYHLIPPIMGEGGDAFTAGGILGHQIKVGATHELQWSQVNCTDGSACLPGLHLGGLKYIESYGGPDNLLLNCFVNPMTIGAFTDTGDGAIRVKDYFVHSAEFAPNKALYHESNYLDHSKEQWETMRSEAIKSSEEKIKGIKQLQEEINAL